MSESLKPVPDFESQKLRYFTKLGLEVRDMLEFHKGLGRLWGEKGTGEDWRNVTEHCLVEVARTKVFSNLLGFSETTMKNLEFAAALHDFNKRNEIEQLKASGLSWDSYESVSKEAVQHMQEAGLSEQIIFLADSVGHRVVPKMEALLSKTELSENDIACLVMYYVDGYTIGSDWVGPVTVSENGEKLNSLNKRIEKDTNNPNYRVINEEGRAHFNGKTSYEMMSEVGMQVEKRLAELVEKKLGAVVGPKQLPFFVDERIKSDIASDNFN